MNPIDKAKQKMQQVKGDWDAAGRRIDEDNAKRPPPMPSPPSAAEQERIQREGQWAVVQNQQQGLTD